MMNDTYRIHTRVSRFRIMLTGQVTNKNRNMSVWLSIEH
jgi:hypothetical protein